MLMSVGAVELISLILKNERRSNKDMNYLSQWGQSTVESLLESTEFQDRLNILLAVAYVHSML